VQKLNTLQHFKGRQRHSCRTKTANITEDDITHTARCQDVSVLRYYYLWFLKTNVCHIGVLLQILIFIFASSLAGHSASAYQISSKSNHQWRSYDIISIIQNGGQGITVLFLVSSFVMSLS